MLTIELPAGKKVYFASDFHLGAPNKEKSLLREKKIIQWLDQIAPDAAHIFLVGDIFDFWYEYAQVIPRGFIRFQGKIAQLRDAGIPITFFSGNHDMWMGKYFTEELGIPIYRRPQELKINNLNIHIAHGDGLGPGDHAYKFLKIIFESKVLRWCFSRLHPNFALWLGRSWSLGRKKKQGTIPDDYDQPEGEYLWHYANEQESIKHRDYYLFGHRHLVLDLQIGQKSRYINIGEWFEACSYAVCNGHEIELKYFNEEVPLIS